MFSWPLGSQPDSALLCPVPAIHLTDALDICQRQGRLAFGTNATELFLTLDKEGAIGHLQVFIFPSFTGAGAASSPALSRLLSKPGTARFAGRLVNIEPPHPRGAERGRHRNPDLRPVSTIAGSSPDTGWDLFWELEGLVSCEVPLSAFVKQGSKAKFAKGFVLQGPTRASAAVAA